MDEVLVPVIDGFQPRKPKWFDAIIPPPKGCQHTGDLEVHFLETFEYRIGGPVTQSRVSGVRGITICHDCGEQVWIPRQRYEDEIRPLCREWIEEHSDLFEFSPPLSELQSSRNVIE